MPLQSSIKQGKKAFLLMRLCSVVGAPFLFIGFLDGNGFSESLRLAIVGNFALNDDLNRVDVFACLLPSLEIGAITMWLHGVRLNRVIRSTVPVLAGNKPSVTIIASLQFLCGRYLQAAFLSFVHCVFSILGKDTAEAYNLGCLGPVSYT